MVESRIQCLYSLCMSGIGIVDWSLKSLGERGKDVQMSDGLRLVRRSDEAVCVIPAYLVGLPLSPVTKPDVLLDEPSQVLVNLDCFQVNLFEIHAFALAFSLD